MRGVATVGSWLWCLLAAMGLIVGSSTSASVQRTEALQVVGLLSTRSPDDDAQVRAFLKGMRDLGYIEGQNLRIEIRWARGSNESLPALAAELADAKPRVIVANSEPGVRAVRDAASATPIVMTNVADPVAAGFAASLAHPAGAITGMSNLGTGLVAKRLELLSQAAPNRGCTGVLRNPDDRRLDPVYWTEITQAGHRLGSILHPALARGAGELESAFAEMARHGCRALVEMPNAAFAAARTQIVTLAAYYQIAAIYDTREFVDVGGLMSYGPDIKDMYRRAASYVDKILKGIQPGDLPIEQPSKFELVFNLKSAKALGLTVPQSLLARADEVIE